MSINYINCLTLGVDFIEQITDTLPICGLKLRYMNTIRLYRTLLAREYLTPVKFLNILSDPQQYANFVNEAIEDFKMMLDSISILLTREAERRVEIITRSYSLRCVPIRLERIASVKSELIKVFYLFVNNVYSQSIQSFTDFITDCCIEIDDIFDFI